MAQFDRRIEMTLAAMLHASYDSGCFPDGRVGFSLAHRKWLASQVGAQVEELAFRYSEFYFETGTPEQMAAEGVPAGHEDILLMALAHEVDDMADGGLAFAPKYGRSIAARVVTALRPRPPTISDTRGLPLGWNGRA